MEQSEYVCGPCLELHHERCKKGECTCAICKIREAQKKEPVSHCRLREIFYDDMLPLILLALLLGFTTPAEAQKTKQTEEGTVLHWIAVLPQLTPKNEVHVFLSSSSFHVVAPDGRILVSIYWLFAKTDVERESAVRTVFDLEKPKITVARFSLNRKSLAFVASADVGNWLTLYTPDREGKFQDLLHLTEGMIEDIYWSPNGRFIAVELVAADGLHNVVVYDVEGKIKPTSIAKLLGLKQAFFRVWGEEKGFSKIYVGAVGASDGPSTGYSWLVGTGSEGTDEITPTPLAQH